MTVAPPNPSVASDGPRRGLDNGAGASSSRPGAGLLDARVREASVVERCDDADVGPKRERRADRALVAAYHEVHLGELIGHVIEAVDRFRAGEQDAFAVDEVLHQYSRAARELWKFCWLAGAGAGVERTARRLRDMAAEDESIDWWQLGAIGERRPPSRAGSPLAPETRPGNPSSS